MLPPLQRRCQAATNIALLRCRHRLAAAKLPHTSRFRAAATAAAAVLLPPRCRHHAVRCRRRAVRCRCHRATAKLPPNLRCRHRRCRRRRTAVRWLVDALLSAVRFRHRMPSATINALVAGRIH